MEGGRAIGALELLGLIGGASLPPFVAFLTTAETKQNVRGVDFHDSY
jgi:hypothetical protein